jgi:hypothetical protein
VRGVAVAGQHRTAAYKQVNECSFIGCAWTKHFRVYKLIMKNRPAIMFCRFKRSRNQIRCPMISFWIYMTTCQNTLQGFFPWWAQTNSSLVPFCNPLHKQKLHTKFCFCFFSEVNTGSSTPTSWCTLPSWWSLWTTFWSTVQGIFLTLKLLKRMPSGLRKWTMLD